MKQAVVVKVEENLVATVNVAVASVFIPKVFDSIELLSIFYIVYVSFSTLLIMLIGLFCFFLCWVSM